MVKTKAQLDYFYLAISNYKKIASSILILFRLINSRCHSPFLGPSHGLRPGPDLDKTWYKTGTQPQISNVPGTGPRPKLVPVLGLCIRPVKFLVPVLLLVPVLVNISAPVTN